MNHVSEMQLVNSERSTRERWDEMRWQTFESVDDGVVFLRVHSAQGALFFFCRGHGQAQPLGIGQRVQTGCNVGLWSVAVYVW